jgi:protocatechuate 3,4-dioxygenase beta subunit
VIYVHHTNAQGVYPARPGDEGWARRHGYLRAWAITNDSGQYRFESIRPAAYPGRRDPAHIHVTVKEPERQEYWIDEVVFTDDPLVTPAYRQAQQERGGSGIVTPVRDARGVWMVRRDIVLER